MLVADGEAGAEVYNAAADREQASIVFNEALNMVRASPALSGRLKPVPSVKRIVYRAQASWYKALSADVPTKEGINWHLLLFDELHAQKRRDLFEVLMYGGAARRQSLALSISTAGYDRDSIGYEQYRYAKDVLEGRIIDTSFFPFIAEAAEADPIDDPATWRKANPSLGVTIREEEMAEAAAEAKNSPSKENAFRRYRLNMWTSSDVRWLSLDKWDACGTAPVNPADLEGKACWGGLDLASTTDLAALVLVFPDLDGNYDVLCWFWCPSEACKRRERENKTRLDAWVRGGFIEATAGEVINYDVIRAKILALREVYDLRELAIDRWNSTQLATQLMAEGVEVIGFGQGFASMSAPTKKLEELVLSGKVRHGGNPVLRWCVGNAQAEQDAAGNIKLSKKKSREKIDGAVALAMSLGRAMVRPETGSVYEERGVETL